MAYTGVECLWLTCFHKPAAGNPSSRAKAQMTREDHVTADSPQNHIAIAASAENRLPARSPSAATRITITAGSEFSPAALPLSVTSKSLVAYVQAIQSRY